MNFKIPMDEKEEICGTQILVPKKRKHPPLKKKFISA